MIGYLAKCVNFLTLLLQNTINFASSIGQIIVILLTTALTAVYNILKSILCFFQIIYEDNVTIFTEDLPYSASRIYDAVHYQWSNIGNIISTFAYDVFFEVNTSISHLRLTLTTVFYVISEVLRIILKALVLLGDALWLLITFVPVHLPYLIKVFLEYIRDCLVNNAIDAYMALLRLTNYLSEVPLKSFMGIITAMIITRSLIHFREAINSLMTDCYWIVIRKVTYLYYMLYNYCTNSEVRTIARFVGGQPLTSRINDGDIRENDEDLANIADTLCIICQERQKCVLTLPCRHVCLCTECCRRLYGYQRTCPICRTFIYHSVNVYL